MQSTRLFVIKKTGPCQFEWHLMFIVNILSEIC